jgi:hypothetical protein
MNSTCHSGLKELLGDRYKLPKKAPEHFCLDSENKYDHLTAVAYIYTS